MARQDYFLHISRRGKHIYSKKGVEGYYMQDTLEKEKGAKIQVCTL